MERKTKLEEAVEDIYLRYTRAHPRQAQPAENLLKKAQLDSLNLPKLRGQLVLEVGPGAGQLATLMTQSGAEVSLMDLVDTYMAQLQAIPGERCWLADIQRPFAAQPAPPRNFFDLVVMCDVLEHVVRPGDALVNAKKLLKPGGYLYVRSPAWETLAKYALASGCESEMTHLRTYTKELLVREVLEAEFLVRASGELRSHTEPRLALVRAQNRSRSGTRVNGLLHSVRYGLPYKGIPRLAVNFANRLFTRPGEVWVLAQKSD